MASIIQYLTVENLASDEDDARKNKMLYIKYTLVVGKLYKMGRVIPMLRFLGKNDATLVLMEVHEGVCESHIRGRTLKNKLSRVRYYWPTFLRGNANFKNKCNK